MESGDAERGQINNIPRQPLPRGCPLESAEHLADPRMQPYRRSDPAGEMSTPAFRVLVTANAFRENAPASEASMRQAGGEVVYPPRMGPLSVDELLPWLRGVDVVIASTDPYNDPVLSQCPRLRAVVRWGTGYDAVDVGACSRHGVVAVNTPGHNVNAVADHALALMLAVARDLPTQFAVIARGEWAEVRGAELAGKTVGLIGFGAIGRAVARRLRGFDCQLLVHDPYAATEALAAVEAVRVELSKLVERSDFVSLHAALTPESRGILSAELLGRMKRTAYVINTARGPLIDEDALVAALRTGAIAGAGLDAYATEPLASDHPLRALPNCVATPHTAFNTTESAAGTNAAVAAAVLQVMRGVLPATTLNPDVVRSPAYRNALPLLD